MVGLVAFFSSLYCGAVVPLFFLPAGDFVEAAVFSSGAPAIRRHLPSSFIGTRHSFPSTSIPSISSPFSSHISSSVSSISPPALSPTSALLPSRSEASLKPALLLSSLISPNKAAVVNDLEAGDVPLNTYSPKGPLDATIGSVRRIVGGVGDAGDICHITIDHGGRLRYWEGQSIGVCPPGLNEKTGKANAVRLYSICSTRYGDDGEGQTLSLSVRRAVFVDESTGQIVEDKKGLCSNFLCNAKSGDPVRITGPCGKMMLLTEDPTRDVIMVGTGTGVAPYRGFWRRLFSHRPSGLSASYEGLAWLFLGVANRDSLLYGDEIYAIMKTHKNFRADFAFSREMQTQDGEKMYIQHKLAENADEIFSRMANGAHIYFCGLKGMMPGIQSSMEASAASRGLVWQDILSEWKKNKQWHVEVY